MLIEVIRCTAAAIHSPPVGQDRSRTANADARAFTNFSSALHSQSISSISQPDDPHRRIQRQPSYVQRRQAHRNTTQHLYHINLRSTHHHKSVHSPPHANLGIPEPQIAQQNFLKPPLHTHAARERIHCAVGEPTQGSPHARAPGGERGCQKSLILIGS